VLSCFKFKSPQILYIPSDLGRCITDFLGGWGWNSRRSADGLMMLVKSNFSMILTVQQTLMARQIYAGLCVANDAVFWFEVKVCRAEWPHFQDLDFRGVPSNGRVTITRSQVRLAGAYRYPSRQAVGTRKMCFAR
jgi:hypothetical protein